MKQVVKSPYTMMHCDGLLGDWTGGDLGGNTGSGMLAVCGRMSRWKSGSVGFQTKEYTMYK